jgi:hypothetical protein
MRLSLFERDYRVSNGDQVSRVAALAMKRSKSANLRDIGNGILTNERTTWNNQTFQAAVFKTCPTHFESTKA